MIIKRPEQLLNQPNKAKAALRNRFNELDQQKIILKREVNREVKIVNEVYEDDETDGNTGKNSKHIGLIYLNREVKTIAALLLTE